MTFKFSWQISSFHFAVQALKNMYGCYANPALLLVTCDEVDFFELKIRTFSKNPMHLNIFNGKPLAPYLIRTTRQPPCDYQRKPTGRQGEHVIKKTKSTIAMRYDN